jgi:hypothetical protein
VRYFEAPTQELLRYHENSNNVPGRARLLRCDEQSLIVSNVERAILKVVSRFRRSALVDGAMLTNEYDVLLTIMWPSCLATGRFEVAATCHTRQQKGGFNCVLGPSRREFNPGHVVERSRE